METRLTVIDRVPADDPRVSLLAQNLCRCRRVARPGFSPGAASAAGDRRCPDPSACVSPALSGQRAPENPAAAARPGQASRANTGRRRTRLRNLRMAAFRSGPSSCRRTGFRNLPPGPCARVDLTLPNLHKYLPRKALLAFLGQAHCIKRQKNSNTAHQSTWYPQD